MCIICLCVVKTSRPITINPSSIITASDLNSLLVLLFSLYILREFAIHSFQFTLASASVLNFLFCIILEAFLIQ